jgi:hypothetical protein
VNCAYNQPQPLQLGPDSHANHKIFNSGVAVFAPSEAAWNDLRKMLDHPQTDLFWGDQRELRVMSRSVLDACG